MTFTQLEYITAVADARHFARAAVKCYVTQPTLSMQIRKLEEELGIRIFDRHKQPVIPTAAGEGIIAQARRILAERDSLLDLAQVQKGVLQGELHIGIIPTLAPYLLPLFISSFTRKYPQIRLVLQELTTTAIIKRLRDGRLDAGLLVTPLHDPAITGEPLFYEEMVAFVSRDNPLFKKSSIHPADLDPEKLWLLEEGHCFRSQVLNLCDLRRSGGIRNIQYEAGSLETLKRMIHYNHGITILPELSTLEMGSRQSQMLRYFRQPVPVREVSLVVFRQVKQRLLQVLREEILAAIPAKIRKNRPRSVIPIETAKK